MYPSDYDTGDDVCDCTFSRYCEGHSEIMTAYEARAQEKQKLLNAYYTRVVAKESKMTTEPKRIKIKKTNGKQCSLTVKDLAVGETFRYPSGNPGNVYIVVAPKDEWKRSQDIDVVSLSSGKLYQAKKTSPVIRVISELRIKDDV